MRGWGRGRPRPHHRIILHYFALLCTILHYLWRRKGSGLWHVTCNFRRWFCVMCDGETSCSVFAGVKQLLFSFFFWKFAQILCNIGAKHRKTILSKIRPNRFFLADLGALSPNPRSVWVVFGRKPGFFVKFRENWATTWDSRSYMLPHFAPSRIALYIWLYLVIDSSASLWHYLCTLLH